MNPLEVLFAGSARALEDVGMADVAATLRGVGDRLDEKYRILSAMTVLDGLGPELVRAYVRAGKFIKRASPAVRDDAVKYQADLFTARCYISATKETAKRMLRGDYALN